ncbi:Carboxypeptidase Taq [Rickettsia typhi str. Wilmington]|uniref:Carboxypeptidase Taq n=2 Tax=Rickettsia typhi TaxID=785 RepID=Q68XI6_RICTY|nr:Carboxypeptidase Taq [Rickettsia typhi str. Wilmington]AFE54034.1 carboxypeptidase Taq [Rickettsia typhi str. TH1527]AFE54873.1 carboxypeptidase Taq [Rickettsia typhi str. B9991CWPP]
MNSNYTALENEFATSPHFNNILSCDVAVNFPINSSSRTNEIITLTSFIHAMIESSIFKELISKAKEKSNNLNKWQDIRKIKKKITDTNCINKQLKKKLVAATTTTEHTWSKAIKNNDYNLFKTHLQKVSDYTEEVTKVREAVLNCGLYDSLINLSKKSSKIKQVFSVLKTALPELIKHTSKKELVQNSELASEMRKLIMQHIMQIMQFDLIKARLDEAIHPFCVWTAHYARLTTRYKYSFISGLMYIINETEYALYEQNLLEIYKGQQVWLAKGIAFHESKSLFMAISRSKKFTEFLAKLLQDEFALKKEEYSAENLYSKTTRVKPDFIRVKAAELTYLMHIILRFEIKEILINGDLHLDELPKFWDSKMYESLVNIPVNFNNGCLQDIN